MKDEGQALIIYTFFISASSVFTISTTTLMITHEAAFLSLFNLSYRSVMEGNER